MFLSNQLLAEVTKRNTVLFLRFVRFSSQNRGRALTAVNIVCS